MKIVSVVVNNPTFIELQYNSIKSFFKSDTDYELIIFNDAKEWGDITNFNDTTMKQQITNICQTLNIQCINIPNLHHKTQHFASIRHADSVNFITNFMLCNPDVYFMLDSDMFFVDYFDIKEFDKYYFCYVNQSRGTVNYPWPNLFYLNVHNIPNKNLINWDVDVGLDAGGKCAIWLSKLEPDKILKLNHLYSGGWDETQIPKSINSNIKLFLNNDVRNQNGKYFAELYHNKILHYRAGSNWMNNSYDLHIFLTNLLKKTFSVF